MSLPSHCVAGHHRAVHRSRYERAWRQEAALTLLRLRAGSGKRRAESDSRGRNEHYAAAWRCRSSDPKNEDMSASATMQQETLLQHHPGWQSLEDRDEVEA
jgi:hypothetical protein